MWVSVHFFPPCDPAECIAVPYVVLAHTLTRPYNACSVWLSCSVCYPEFLFCSSVQMKGFIAIALLLCLSSAHKSGDVKHKWWSIPEPVATVGKLFYFKIPLDSAVDNTSPVDVRDLSICLISIFKA